MWKWLICSAALTGLVAGMFGIFPKLDQETSAFFYNQSNGFYLGKVSVLSAFRELVWNVSILLFIFCIAGFLFLRLRGGNSKYFEIGILVYLLGPILLVNVILKEFWGRARPSQITDFGGEKMFTPFYEITNQCASNCSFVSGEASGATAILIVAALLTWAYCGARVQIVTVGLSTIVLIGSGVLRVGLGGHFASDVLLSILFTVLIFFIVIRHHRYRQIFM